MAGATIEAPPDPPALMITPTMSPCRRIQSSKASAIAATDAPRSRPNTRRPPRPWLSAISWAVTSQVASLPLVETSTRRVRKPAAGDDVADESQFRALGVERADDEHGRRSGASRRVGARRVGGLLERVSTPTESVRALDLDPRDRHRLRPSGRRTSDWKCRSDRRGAGLVGGGEAAGPRARRWPPRSELRLGVGMAADAEQALLEITVGGEARGLDDAIDRGR